MKTKKLLALLLALAMVFALAACSTSDEDDSDTEDTAEETAAEVSDDSGASESTDSSDSAAAEFKEIDVNIGIYASTIFTAAFDVGGIYSNLGVGCGTQMLVYDQLFYLDSTGTYQTRVVDSIEIVDDTTIVIQLKDGIYFSNGEQLTAVDVFYSLDTMQNSGRRSEYYTCFNLDKSYYSDDGLTITFIMDEPYAAIYDAMDFGIMCASYCQGNEENIDWYDPDQVVGSGPYVCTQFYSNASATYEKRDDYWGLAYGYNDIYSTINVTQYQDQSTLSIDFETGAVDVALDISLEDYERLTDMGGNITTSLISSNVPYLLVFDLNNNAYLADYNVRKAICMAIDVDALTDSVAGSFGIVADSAFGQNELGYLGGLTYEYDPDGARQLLEEAGYGDGFELTFNIIGSEPYTSIAEIVNYYLGEIGIVVNIGSTEMMSYVNQATDPDYSDMQIYTMTGGNPNGEPIMQLSNWYSNMADTSPIMARNYDDILDAAAGTLDDSVRIENYQAFQQALYDNCDCLPLYEFCSAYAYNNEIFEDFTICSVQNTWILDAILA